MVWEGGAWIGWIIKKESKICFDAFCAQDETRTHTTQRPLPPQSSVYTNFTTCARRNALLNEISYGEGTGRFL